MKSILKTLFIFLFFAFSLCLTAHCETQTLAVGNYIQNNYQKVVLISQNLPSGEVTASFNNTNPGDGSDITQDTCFINISANINPQVSAENIHNLSTCLTNEISIRAP